MVGRAPQGRSAEYAWLITGPLAIFTIIAFVIFWIVDPHWYRDWLLGLVLFGAYLVAFVGVFRLQSRRSTLNIYLTEIPLLLAFYYLPPIMVIVMVGAASMIMQFRTAAVPTKRWFNLAKSTAAATAR